AALAPLDPKAELSGKPGELRADGVSVWQLFCDYRGHDPPRGSVRSGGFAASCPAPGQGMLPGWQRDSSPPGEVLALPIVRRRKWNVKLNNGRIDTHGAGRHTWRSAPTLRAPGTDRGKPGQISGRRTA